MQPQKIIPYGCQDLNEADIQAVLDVLQSDWLTQGPAVPRFERVVAQYCGVEYAVAVNSGTSALHLACRALELEPGDWLWTSPNTFVASANCALYCGAQVDFVEIDPRTYNMSVPALENKLQRAQRDGCLPKVVIPVHFAGQPVDMASIGRLAERYGFHVIEDACHALGARYGNSQVGSCENSDLTVFSFHPVKLITTGEGGMVVTRRQSLREKLILLRSHGITRETAQMRDPSEGPWYYQQIDLGYNFRLTDIQAALGVSQMARLEEFISRRHYLANRYHQALKELPLVLPWQQPESHSAWHLYVIRLRLQELNHSRREVFDFLRQAGIGVNVHYIPVHLQPYYRAQGFSRGDFPEAERYYAEAISLPLYYRLSEAQQDRVIAALKDALR